MSRTPRIAFRVFVACLLTSIGLGGCSKKIWVYQTPQFYDASLKSIQVLPFRNASTAKGQNPGTVVADQLVAAMRSNGTYTVLSASERKTLIDESELQAALSSNAVSAMDLSKLTDAEAILTGTVTTYAATSQRRTEQQPIYGYDRRGRQYISHYVSRQITHNEANVAVTAALIRKSDGHVIHSTPGPIHGKKVVEGTSVPDPYACAADARQQVVSGLVEQFCVVRKQVKIDIGKAVQIGTGFYDGKWEKQEAFTTADEKMLVAVMLPKECDRNPFRITIVRKDGREDLAVKPFKWDANQGAMQLAFSPRELAAKGGGAGNYEVKFYSGPEPVIRKAFRITEQ